MISLNSHLSYCSAHAGEWRRDSIATQLVNERQISIHRIEPEQPQGPLQGNHLPRHTCNHPHSSGPRENAQGCKLGQGDPPHSCIMRPLLLWGQDCVKRQRWLHGSGTLCPWCEHEPAPWLGQEQLRLPRGWWAQLQEQRDRAAIWPNIHHWGRDWMWD